MPTTIAAVRRGGCTHDTDCLRVLHGENSRTAVSTCQPATHTCVLSPRPCTWHPPAAGDSPPGGLLLPHPVILVICSHAALPNAVSNATILPLPRFMHRESSHNAYSDIDFVLPQYTLCLSAILNTFNQLRQRSLSPPPAQYLGKMSTESLECHTCLLTACLMSCARSPIIPRL
ncbi:hypothetical protein L226DRAFT_108895 [Lentinus tigrinus ALCF2SS1-7]|uniref:Uncharacterized protein n=1 Tax=Lentinus tigrinus ALCF2SS1-6 TaxID=1328759 RepID=A0A5C2S6P1_9APHY|nr:hypothetical protein L227DRAFT_170290 [Lentinus tigrinus ALCF2SS1-6]RPD73368.1 hypothetical protein L226DRAFT_108895 [Lentinus tigrinus ALCF2SS1-7]